MGSHRTSRRALRCAATGCLATLASFSGCIESRAPTGLGDGGGGGGTTGALQVTVATVGSNLDANGYQLLFNELTSYPVGINAEVTFSTVAIGSYQITLADVASNCVIEGSSDTKGFSVSAGATTMVDFEVDCS